MEIRRSYDRLISTMGFLILVKRNLYTGTGPGALAMELRLSCINPSQWCLGIIQLRLNRQCATIIFNRVSPNSIIDLPFRSSSRCSQTMNLIQPRRRLTALWVFVVTAARGGLQLRMQVLQWLRLSSETDWALSPVWLGWFLNKYGQLHEPSDG